MSQLKESVGNSTMLEYTDGRASIISGQNSVSSTETDGNFINGSLSISSKPTNIRIGGIYTFHPLTLTGIPSTNVTPIPTFKLNVPTKGLKTSMSIANTLRSL
jgi:hypothetical protein